MIPINYDFVSTQTLAMANNDDGSPKEITVLVLDKEANLAYWKKFHCFSGLINQLELKSPTEAKHWLITRKFAQCKAIVDLATELIGLSEVQMVKDVTPVLEEIWEIPVVWTDEDEERCQLVLADERVIENELWK